MDAAPVRVGNHGDAVARRIACGAIGREGNDGVFQRSVLGRVGACADSGRVCDGPHERTRQVVGLSKLKDRLRPSAAKSGRQERVVTRGIAAEALIVSAAQLVVRSAPYRMKQINQEERRRGRERVDDVRRPTAGAGPSEFRFVVACGVAAGPALTRQLDAVGGEDDRLADSKVLGQNGVVVARRALVDVAA